MIRLERWSRVIGRDVFWVVVWNGGIFGNQMERGLSSLGSFLFLTVLQGRRLGSKLLRPSPSFRICLHFLWGIVTGTWV